MMKYFLILLFTISALAQQKVYVAHIDGDIDLGLAPYISRVINDAEEDNADGLIVLFTPGRFEFG